MGEFTNKTFQFTCRGMSLLPPHRIPEGKFALLKNVRSYREGIIEPRPGLELISNQYMDSDGVPRSISKVTGARRVNDFNPTSVGSYARVVMAADGIDGQIFFGQDAQFVMADSGYSTDKASMVVFQPEGTNSPWLYVWDSVKCRKFCTSETTAGSVYSYPTPLSIGLPMPVSVWASPVITKVAGGLTGTYSWRFRYRDPRTNTKGAPGPACYQNQSLSSQAAEMRLPVWGTRTVLVSSPVVVDVFRYSVGVVNKWMWVGSGNPGDTFTDNLSDAAITASEILDENLLQPFPVPDSPHSGVCNTVAATSTSGSMVVYISGDAFNEGWLPGAKVVVDGVTCTLRCFQAPSFFEVEEDLGYRTDVTWEIKEATIVGEPLQHVWGPYGGGSDALYVFAVGDLRRAGAVYWTNGNDPDSTSLTNWLEVTSPSEPLQNGCIYDGKIFVWSTERMFRLVPQSDGGFLAYEVPGSRGLFSPNAFCVGDLIYYRSKDGIYATDGAVNTISITDNDVFSFFHHESQPPVAIEVGDVTLYPPDPWHYLLETLTFSNGYLYFDYHDTNNSNPQTLVYCTHAVGKGWYWDNYGFLNQFGTRCVEEGYDTHLIVGVFGLFYITGQVDFGAVIDCRVITPALSSGDNREEMLLGDAALKADPSNGILNVLVRRNDNRETVRTAAVSGGTTATTIIDINDGRGELGTNFNLDIQWSSFSRPSLYEYALSVVPKVVSTKQRATDYTNDGYPGDKRVKGCIIHADISKISGSDLVVNMFDEYTVVSPTYAFTLANIGSTMEIQGTGKWVNGTYRIVGISGTGAILDKSPGAGNTSGGSFSLGGTKFITVEYNGGAIGPSVIISHPGESSILYSLEPFIAKTMRLVPGGDPILCRLYTVTWIWDKVPEDATMADEMSDLGEPGVTKYVRGMILTGDSGGSQTTMEVQKDGEVLHQSVTLALDGKDRHLVNFDPPFMTDMIRLVPRNRIRNYGVEWVYDKYPVLAQMYTPWHGGEPGYYRGVVIEADTANVPVSVTVQRDGGISTLETLTCTHNGMSAKEYSFTLPFYANTLRMVPAGQWRFQRVVKWIVDPAPDKVGGYGPWVDLGYSGSKLIKGVLLDADTEGSQVLQSVIKDGGAIADTLTVNHGIRVKAPYQFTNPFYSVLVRRGPVTWPYRSWDADWTWIYEKAPELTTIPTEWDNAGHDGDKFVQGARITLQADTALNLNVQKDGGIGAATADVTTALAYQQTLPFSWIPFTAHNLRLVPTAACRLYKVEWIWEPLPELATLWMTQEMSHGAEEYSIIRDAQIAIMGALSEVTMYVTTETGATAYTIPATGIGYKKQSVVLQPHKSRFWKYTFSSPAPFRLFKNDCWVRIKAVGSQEGFRRVNPFGDIHAIDGAKI